MKKDIMKDIIKDDKHNKKIEKIIEYAKKLRISILEMVYNAKSRTYRRKYVYSRYTFCYHAGF